jgi:hypothetical protein
MKRVASICVVLALSFLVVHAVGAQGAGGVPVTCQDGVEFTNGVEVQILQMRTGFDYTATVVGLNGFDPVLAVLGEGGEGLCNDDATTAQRYSAILPTTGRVPASNLSAQVTFTPPNSTTGFHDISLVVGGYGDQTGEFLLILEGMGVTAADNSGDPVSVLLTQPMLDSGVPLDVYMITRGQSNVDPIISLVDSDLNVLSDSDGLAITCDDAGTNSCWTQGSDLSNSSVTIDTGTLPGWQYDSYLSLDVSGVTLSKDPEENRLLFLLSSYQGTQGQYLLAIHGGL